MELDRHHTKNIAWNLAVHTPPAAKSSTKSYSHPTLFVAKPTGISSPYVLHEKRNHAPAGWSHSRKHDPSSIIPLRFGLSQPNIDDIGEYLNDIANPDSPNYGSRHWTPEQVTEKFAPSDETIETVRFWLLRSGFAFEKIHVTGTKGWIEVDATVEEAEHLLKAEYHVYKHASGKEHVACESYHLPSHIAHHVDLVTPTIHFNAIIPRSSEPDHSVRDAHSEGPVIKSGNPGHSFVGPVTVGDYSSEVFNNLSTCDEYITPACLRALYGLSYKPVAEDKNSFAIVEYTPQAYFGSDIDRFGRTFDPTLVGKRPKLVSIDGGIVQHAHTGILYDAESGLDLQYAMSLVTPKQEVSLYQVGDPVIKASFNTLLDALDASYCTFQDPSDPRYPDPAPGGYHKGPDCGTVKPANVISTSYSYNEADLSPAYSARQCAEYGKLGLMGVTVLFSTGDFGVAGNGKLCLNPDGSQTIDGRFFNPSFPSSCPFVTAVGATQVDPGSTVCDPESASWLVVYSGGGFSNHFAIPEYQKAAVKNYLDSHPGYKDRYNSTGKSRAFPDLSANGEHYVVSIAGQFYLSSGTSASTPVVGAILTLVNDARLAAGKIPIGFINPTIYSPKFASAFHDITNGTNPGCGTRGFKASSGWDPVTGLGTPNFPELVSRWLALP